MNQPNKPTPTAAVSIREYLYKVMSGNGVSSVSSLTYREGMRRLETIDFAHALLMTDATDEHLVRRYFSPRQCNYISPRTATRYPSIGELRLALSNESEVKRENMPIDVITTRWITLSGAVDIVTEVARDILRAHESDGDFLSSCYEEILGHGVDHDGLEHYSHQLSSGQMTRDQIISDIWHSPEGQGRDVTVVEQASDRKTSIVAIETQTELSSPSLPIYVRMDTETFIGMNVHVVQDDAEGTLSSWGDEYLLHGPKVRLLAGRYRLQIDLRVIEGFARLDATGFCGIDKYLELTVAGELQGNFLLDFVLNVDFFEVRIKGLSQERNTIAVRRVVIHRENG
jgi:hypothetical protein